LQAEAQKLGAVSGVGIEGKEFRLPRFALIVVAVQTVLGVFFTATSLSGTVSCLLSVK
jgi:hypothetical protein